MVDGVVIQVLGGDGLLDDVLLDRLAELLSSDVGGVLGGDDDGVDTDGDNSAVVVLVLDSDLGLGVGPQPRQGAVAAGSGHGRVELVGEHQGEGEELRGLVGSIAEHDALVTGAEALKRLVVVQSLGNVGGLLLNGDEQVAGLVVEALGGVIVADALDGFTDDLLVVEVGPRGNLTEDHDHASLGGSLAGNLGERVLGQAGIEDGIGNLVGNLVGVALADGLGLCTAVRSGEVRQHPKLPTTTPRRRRDKISGPGWSAYSEQEGALGLLRNAHAVGAVGAVDYRHDCGGRERRCNV